MAERLFLAAPLPEHARSELRRHLDDCGTSMPGRVVPPRNWHLTLRFLGDTPPDQRAAFVAELANAELPGPFELAFGEFGAFPRAARARAVWAGIEQGRDELERIAAAAEAAARAAGFPPEDRPFRPHLTVSRLRPPADVRPLLQALGRADVRTSVSEIALYRSELGGGPPVYEAVESWALAGAG